MGIIYLGSQVSHLENRVDKIDKGVVGVTVKINNGTETVSREIYLTSGATPLEALRRVASVGTKEYPGMGKMVTSISGVKRNESSGKYWLVASRQSDSVNWTGLSKSVSKANIRNKTKFLFWYGKTSNAPFEAF